LAWFTASLTVRADTGNSKVPRASDHRIRPCSGVLGNGIVLLIKYEFLRASSTTQVLCDLHMLQCMHPAWSSSRVLTAHGMPQ
jgi:hypothetical protein